MRTRLSICAAKHRYPTANDAHLAAAAATIALRPYRCDRCGAFHLTSRTKGKRVPRPDVARSTPSSRRKPGPRSVKSIVPTPNGIPASAGTTLPPPL